MGAAPDGWLAVVYLKVLNSLLGADLLRHQVWQVMAAVLPAQQAAP